MIHRKARETGVRNRINIQKTNNAVADLSPDTSIII